MNVADTEIDGRRPGRQGRPDPSGTGEPLTVGSLFSGIGGFDLGFERAGMRTVWFCEQDEFCRSVLAKHWPGVPCYPDVRALVADTGRGGVRGGARPGAVLGAPARGQGEGDQRERDGHPAGGGGADGPDVAGPGGAAVPVPVPYVDVLCGGFPCQDLSVAGKGAGIDGERSGLWGEYARLIRELRPRYVVVENVSALLGRGLGRVLGDLAACGYDAEWDCVPASAVGAPHRRDRLWLVAYPGIAGPQGPGLAEGGEVGAVAGAPSGNGYVADAEGQPVGAGLREGQPGGVGRGRPGYISCADHPWAIESDVGRVATRVPNRVDRLSALGNALVPQIAEWLGRRIIETEEQLT